MLSDDPRLRPRRSLFEPTPSSERFLSIVRVHRSSSASSVHATADPVVVEVGLGGDRTYPIYIGENLMDQKNGAELLRKHVTGQQVLLVTNDNIDKWYLDKYVGVWGEGAGWV